MFTRAIFTCSSYYFAVLCLLSLLAINTSARAPIYLATTNGVGDLADLQAIVAYGVFDGVLSVSHVEMNGR